MMEQAMSKQESNPETKKLIDKPIDKFASKTCYGMNPLELAKKFDEDNTNKKIENSEQKGDDIEKKVENVNKKPFSLFQSNPIPIAETEKQTFETTKIKEQEQHKNPFQSFGGNKASSPFASKPKEDFSSKPSLSAAIFGKSSLDIEVDNQERQNESEVKIERTFGGAKHEASSGFKSLFGTGQPSQNTFLTNKGNKEDDNDMADEDIFDDGSNPVASSSGFFGGSASSFPQAKPNPFSSGNAGSSLKSSLGFDPTKPSFSQRRK